jgi:hypothetical protein
VGNTQSSKKIAYGQNQYGFFLKKEKVVNTHDLINMNHTIPIRDKAPNCVMSLALA